MPGIEADLPADSSIDFERFIPLFPLPNTVLFPCAILPLHIFERRYRMMTRDALAGPRLIAMALLKPGYEPRYHQNDPAIHDVVCVGRILRDEQLPDGRYNLLLQGLVPARVAEENHDLTYRRAYVAPTAVVPIELDSENRLRQELRAVLSQPPYTEIATKAHWLPLLDCPDLILSDVLDVLASVALPTVDEKQAFLEDRSIISRTGRLCAFFRSVRLAFCDYEQHWLKHCRPWPPSCFLN